MAPAVSQVAYDIECEEGQPCMEVDDAFDAVFVHEAMIQFGHEDSNGPLDERFIRQYDCLCKEGIHGFSNVLVPYRVGV